MTALPAPRPVAAARRKAAGAAPTRRGRPPKAKAQAAGETRDLILDAAEDLFSKHGFYGVTIREVARDGDARFGGVRA